MPARLDAIVRDRLVTWLPAAKVTPAPPDQADGLLLWKGPRGTIRYLLAFRNHLPQQDVQVLAHRLEARARALPRTRATTRVLLLAPYVPPRQAEFLRRRGIDYADEAGNAHLDAPGVLVHVEGKRPDRAAAARGGITKAWVKVVLAGLLNPTRFEGPYTALAEAAGVTAPTVMTCLRDLRRRGLLVARGRRRRLVGRRELLPLWTNAYVHTLRPRLLERRFRMPGAAGPNEPLTRVQTVLRAHGVAWCTTGATAALDLTRYYQTDAVEIYADPRAMTDRVVRELKAQPTGDQANLIVIEPPIPGLVGDVGRQDEPFPTAPALLAYAELRYHGTDQATEAADMLLPLIEEPDGTAP